MFGPSRHHGPSSRGRRWWAGRVAAVAAVAGCGVLALPGHAQARLSYAGHAGVSPAARQAEKDGHELTSLPAATVSDVKAAALPLPLRLRAYYWAHRQAGRSYCWGGIGPGCFDCSGLVMSAYRHAGTSLPRTTYGMLGSPLLRRVWHPRMGDLAFYGTGHVELFRRWGWTFGAHDSRSLIGLVRYGWGWAPTAFYRVR